MKRLLAIMVLCGCAGVTPHVHMQDPNQPCSSTCTGFCASAYDADGQTEVACGDPAGDLCICTPTEESEQ